MSLYWRTKEGEQYYYNADGHLLLNVGVKIDGYWYYFDESGKMLRSGWRVKEGNLYYYNADGHLLLNQEAVIDGVTYRFDANGKLIREQDITAKIAEISTYTKSRQPTSSLVRK